MAENTTTAATESEAVNTLNDERARRLADRASLSSVKTTSLVA